MMKQRMMAARAAILFFLFFGAFEARADCTFDRIEHFLRTRQVEQDTGLVLSPHGGGGFEAQASCGDPFFGGKLTVGAEAQAGFFPHAYGWRGGSGDEFRLFVEDEWWVNHLRLRMKLDGLMEDPFPTNTAVKVSAEVARPLRAWGPLTITPTAKIVNFAGLSRFIPGDINLVEVGADLSVDLGEFSRYLRGVGIDLKPRLVGNIMPPRIPLYRFMRDPVFPTLDARLNYQLTDWLDVYLNYSRFDRRASATLGAGVTF